MILTEQRFVSDSFGLLRDIDVAVTHRLYLAQTCEWLQHHILTADEVSTEQTVFQLVERHHTVNSNLFFSYFDFHLFSDIPLRLRAEVRSPMPMPIRIRKANPYYWQCILIERRQKKSANTRLIWCLQIITNYSIFI